jgi:hypothetical protein
MNQIIDMLNAGIVTPDDLVEALWDIDMLDKLNEESIDRMDEIFDYLHI